MQQQGRELLDAFFFCPQTFERTQVARAFDWGREDDALGVRGSFCCIAGGVEVPSVSFCRGGRESSRVCWFNLRVLVSLR